MNNVPNSWNSSMSSAHNSLPSPPYKVKATAERGFSLVVEICPHTCTSLRQLPNIQHCWWPEQQVINHLFVTFCFTWQVDTHSEAGFPCGREGQQSLVRFKEGCQTCSRSLAWLMTHRTYQLKQGWGSWFILEFTVIAVLVLTISMSIWICKICLQPKKVPLVFLIYRVTCSCNIIYGLGLRNAHTDDCVRPTWFMTV